MAETVPSTKRGREEEEHVEDKKPKVEYKNPNDWTCPNCGHHVYASRPSCPKCSTLRNTPLVATGPAPNQEVRPGDWTCSSCGDHNYATRMVCRKCGTPKDPNSQAGPVATAGKGSIRPGDWNCPSCGEHNYATRMSCRRCNTPKSSATQIRGAMGQMGGMYGGAMGAVAQNGFYGAGAGAGRNVYVDPYTGVATGGVGGGMNGMGGMGGGVTGMGGGMGAMGGGIPNGGRPGDWLCPSCGDHNYAFRDTCRKCGTPKGGAAGAGAMGGVAAGGGIPGMQGGTRPGDWECPNCGDLNYASRTECRKCHTAKPADAKSITVPVMGGRPGDWLCSKCKSHNYASRTECFQCGAPKS